MTCAQGLGWPDALAIVAVMAGFAAIAWAVARADTAGQAGKGE